MAHFSVINSEETVGHIRYLVEVLFFATNLEQVLVIDEVFTFQNANICQFFTF